MYASTVYAFDPSMYMQRQDTAVAGAPPSTDVHLLPHYNLITHKIKTFDAYASDAYAPQIPAYSINLTVNLPGHIPRCI